jgi:hypothetical protein
MPSAKKIAPLVAHGSGLRSLRRHLQRIPISSHVHWPDPCVRVARARMQQEENFVFHTIAYHEDELGDASALAS